MYVLHTFTSYAYSLSPLTHLFSSFHFLTYIFHQCFHLFSPCISFRSFSAHSASPPPVLYFTLILFPLTRSLVPPVYSLHFLHSFLLSFLRGGCELSPCCLVSHTPSPILPLPMPCIALPCPATSSCPKVLGIE